MRTEYNLRKDLIEVCKRMYQKGFIAATDGNVSIRINENRIIFTPSGMCKGYLEADDLIITDLTGKKISGKYNASTEINMHLAAYRERPDITAVVHGHPPTAVAFTFANIALSECLLPEVIVTLGNIPVVPYETTGTYELASAISPYIREYDAVILDKHGVVAVGKDVFDAFYKLEKVEHNAHVVYMAKQLGRLDPLKPEQINELMKLRAKMHNS
jgi:L-fuculose-phosphate aldolase